MKIGVICDGISRDLKHALDVMDEFELQFAELQFVWDKEIGDHSPDEVRLIKQLIEGHGKVVSCLSRHLFAGTTVQTRVGDDLHNLHMDKLKRVIEVANVLGSPLVRTMAPKKETIIWGEGGAEIWNVAKGAWDNTLEIMAPAVDLARSEGIKLVVETGNGIMINSAYTARRMIDELDAKDTLLVLWDPANCCWCHERAYPEAYEEIRDGYIGHIHLKDVEVDTPRSLLKVCEFGTGQLGNQFKPMADALRADRYDGIISLESVFHPGDRSFESGFRLCIDKFTEIFCPESRGTLT